VDSPKLEAFLVRGAQAADPGNPELPRQFVSGFQRSLGSFNFLASDSHWLLAAELDRRFVGYLSAARIHKVDRRTAVLFVDELMVLGPYRRRGIATALWREAQAIAREIGAWRIRLLVETENQAARSFRRKMGLGENPLVLCQQVLTV
jgi:GNAT superfamily N-acetyltransferase